MRLKLACALFILSLCAFAPVMARAQGLTIIRDSEIEQALKAWCTPMWKAGGLHPDAIKLVLIQSPEMNAFVAGGQNIFVYTGLIEATKDVGELLGVIAHESGHIVGGHLVLGKQAMERASYESMLATILGAGAAIGGNGDAAGALILGGQSMAMGRYLAHSRVQESSADQAALRFMEGAHYNPSGLEHFLSTLKDQELLPPSQQDAYLRTHPLTSERIDAMDIGVAKSAYKNAIYPPAMVERYKRIKAKLAAFIDPRRVPWIYPDTDTSTPALYARAIAAYRTYHKQSALKLIDTLIKREPDNAWFYELKGQMSRDFGDLNTAADNYRQAIKLEPRAALIRIDLAQVLIEMPRGDIQARYAEAQKHLAIALEAEPRSALIHRLYATIYGRENKQGYMRYHLAEEAAIQGKTAQAASLLKAAIPDLPKGSRISRHANDLKAYLDAQPKK